MPNHAIRVAMAYDDISGVIETWADRSIRCVVYEHPKDASVNKTHVHIALYGCNVEAEALKRDYKNRPADAKGNKFWSWKELETPPDVFWEQWRETQQELQRQALKYLTYMTKGKYTEKYRKNISRELLDKAKELWEPPAPNQKPAKSKNIDKAKEDLYTIVEEVEKVFEEEHKAREVYNKTLKAHGCSCGPDGHFRQICYIVMKILERKRKRFNSYDFERYVYPVWTKKFEDSKSLFIDGLWKKFDRV